MFGDTNQCDPVESKSQVHHDYFMSVAISEMCPKRVEMKYKENSSRYDVQTRDMLTEFLKTGRVTTKFAPIGTYNKNTCYLNTTRHTVTKECCDRFLQDNEYCAVKFVNI